MDTVIVASENPVKIDAAKYAFVKIFPSESWAIEGHSVATSIPDQPLSDADTLEGAKQRATGAKKDMPEAAYWVGIEGGVEREDRGMASFAWVYVIDVDGRIGFGKSATFYLPPRVAELIEQGHELGEADDIVFGHSDSKQKQGAIGILTHNVITRTDLYIQAVATALIPFSNMKLYSRE